MTAPAATPSYRRGYLSRDPFADCHVVDRDSDLVCLTALALESPRGRGSLRHVSTRAQSPGPAALRPVHFERQNPWRCAYEFARAFLQKQASGRAMPANDRATRFLAWQVHA